MFRRKLDVKQEVRAQQRALRGTGRDLDREIMAVERDEKKTIAEMKALAKRGDVASAKVLAKSIVQLRAQKTKIYTAKANLAGTSTSMSAAASTHKLASAMKQSTKAMTAVGAAVKPAKVQADMAAFAKENARMDMTSELMDEAMDSALGDDEEEDESEDIINQVLDEIGVGDMARMGAAPSKVQAVAAPAQEEAEADDLVARLAALNS